MPDTAPYLALGLGVVFTILGVYIGSLVMRFRRADPPPVVASVLGERGQLLGAAEAAFDAVLSDQGLEAWSLSLGKA